MSSDIELDQLGWIPAGKRLAATLKLAADAASRESADEISVEHVLAALLENVDAARFFATHGADVEAVRAHCGVADEAAEPEPEPEPIPEPASAAAPAPTRWDAGSSIDTGYGASADGARRDGFGGDASYDAARRGYANGGGESYGASGGYGARDPWAQPTARAYGADYATPARAASAPAARAKPSRDLRRLMARASDLAEQEGRSELMGDVVIRAITADADGATGALLRRLVPKDKQVQHPKERLVLAAQAEAAERQKVKSASKAAVEEPAYAALIKRSDAFLKALHSELQKDLRYRVANDLMKLMRDRDPNAMITREGENLGEAALPIVHATRAELQRDPHFRAYEQVRVSLQNIRTEHDYVCRALARLVADGLLPDGASLGKAARALIDLDAVSAEANDRFTPPDVAAGHGAPQVMQAIEMVVEPQSSSAAEPIHDEASIREVAEQVRVVSETLSEQRRQADEALREAHLEDRAADERSRMSLRSLFARRRAEAEGGYANGAGV